MNIAILLPLQVPRLLGLHTQKVFQSSQGWVPVFTEPMKQNKIQMKSENNQTPNELKDIQIDKNQTPNELKDIPTNTLFDQATIDKSRIKVMSIGFLLSNNDEAIVWRGPKKTAMIKQFIQDVQWGSLDYLIIDTPP